MSGSMNWAVVVAFNDGVEWIFRSPRPGALSDEYAARVLASEVATLNYISTHSSVPVPEVFAYSASRQNDLGVPYILMSQAPGRRLVDYELRQVKGVPELMDDDRMTIMRQLGAITSQLSHLRQPKIGSLFQDSDGNYTIGEESAYLEALVAAYVSHAQELSLSYHAFFAPIPDPTEYTSVASYRAAVGWWNDFVAVGQKIDHSRNRLAYCISGQLLGEMVPRLSGDAAAGGEGFPLAHPDLHTGNVFVDSELNVSCLIDWGFASAVPASELLATPPLWEPEAGLVGSFRCGVVADRQMWGRVDRIWSFQRVVRLLSTRDYYHFAALCEEAVDIPFLFQQRAQERGSKKLLEELAAEDSTAEYVAKEELASFGTLNAVDDYGRQETVAMARESAGGSTFYTAEVYTLLRRSLLRDSSERFAIILFETRAE
ncbi:kinase-like domain protein [Phialemonium atrogriseum]|uniref:Kinase-like domain protein n=1 Tax=Phialemonium atrogriseum TaxID=1093897 RepID=A0AAJ0FM44_9PEZI|nr:kinase-like domain protein [Phialemonium atrogriseum]KAK1767414.1 kinase-like domain protein [Phialemonium atrogriseum]